jgi:hypothetical protein
MKRRQELFAQRLLLHARLWMPQLKISLRNG